MVATRPGCHNVISVARRAWSAREWPPVAATEAASPGQLIDRARLGMCRMYASAGSSGT
jgi:hypothetical protein